MTLFRKKNVLTRGLHWLRRLRKVVAEQPAVQSRLKTIENEIALSGKRIQGEHAARVWGVPLDIFQANQEYSLPYRPDREGLRIRYLGNFLSAEQPDSLWFDNRSQPAKPILLGGRIDLQVGDTLRVGDHHLFDLSIGSLLVKALHEPSGVTGFISLETLAAETMECDGALWVATDKARLRDMVEFETDRGILYSTNRVSQTEVEASTSYLEQFLPGRNTTERLTTTIHPLQAGAHAHRLGAWALSVKRSAEERRNAATLIDAMLDAYGMRVAKKTSGEMAWPYTFDFSMPWGTKLIPPWYSGYANSAMVGACACAWRLTAKDRYREAAYGGIAFLRRPMSNGGALYIADGFKYLAEYCYASPPIPNYRVLDGEICSLVFLYNTALLMRDSELLSFAIELAAGLSRSLDLFCADGNGLPVFGMDGQAMNPSYMWQLWMSLQLLANAFKDRQFSFHASKWRSGIPQHVIDEGYPL